MKITITGEHGEVSGNETITISRDLGYITDALELFENFLRGAGFVFDGELEISGRTEQPKVVAARASDQFVGVATEDCKKGDLVSITNSGTYHVTVNDFVENGECSPNLLNKPFDEHGPIKPLAAMCKPARKQKSKKKKRK